MIEHLNYIDKKAKIKSKRLYYKMNVFEPVVEFFEQSKRVLNVTHKPQDLEFKQMTFTTGLGLTVIGLIGFIISMASHYLRVF